MNELVTVAMVAPCAFPANHGTPAAIKELSEALAKRGHRIEVVTYPVFDEGIPFENVAIHRGPTIRAHRRPLGVGPSWRRLGYDAGLVSTLVRIIHVTGAQLMHAHNFEGVLAAYPARLLTGRPLIYNAINSMVDELPTYNLIRPKAVVNTLAKTLDRWVPRMADHVIADTRQLYDFILSRGVPAERVNVVPSGVKVAMFSGLDGRECRRRLGLEGKRVVIYTGTFDFFQGVNRLIAAFSKVASKCPESVLLLVGGTVTAQRSQLYRQTASELGIGSRVVITSCGLSEVPSYLAAADVAVVPRVSPTAGGIPTKLLNYMAAGKAIVCHRSSGAFLVHRESAWLAGPDPEEFAQGMLCLLNDDSLVAHLGANARRLAETTFNWSKIAQEVETVYRGVLSRRKLTEQKAVSPPSSSVDRRVINQRQS